MFFRRQPTPESKRAAVTKVVIELLGIQRCMIANFNLDNDDGNPNGKALGYVLGFLDSAIQIANLEITDGQLTMILLAVLHQFAPSKSGEYVTFLKRSAMTDPAVMNGLMLGGVQYRDWCANPGHALLGWGRCFNPKPPARATTADNM